MIGGRRGGPGGSRRGAARGGAPGAVLGLAAPLLFGCNPGPGPMTPAVEVAVPAPEPLSPRAAGGDEPEGCPPVAPPGDWQGEPVAEVPVSPGDPRRGVFTLADATRGLPGAGPLIARIATDRGELRCELWPERAPITVANFVGLARGLRPWKTPSGWRATPAYDGTTFHRIIKGFMAQGGDPKGNGTGEPGYVIPDEIWEGARHDQRGMLCMANRGKNTNGVQFFILDAPTPHLDGGYTIFGQCAPDEVIDAIAGAQVQPGGSAPVDPPRIDRVRIERERPDAPCER
jgi:peptidyl-prolyl cis-trans isomerase A (cyclophilin A)